MLIPDLNTLVLLLILVEIATTVFMFLYWRAHKTYSGYLSWMVSIPVLATGYIFTTLAGSMPGALFIVAANVLILFGYLLRCDGIWRFIRSKKINTWIYAAILVPAFLFFLYVTISGDTALPRILFRSIVFPLIIIASIIPLILSQERENRDVRLTFAALGIIEVVLYPFRLIFWEFSLISLTAVPPDPYQISFYTYLVLVDMLAPWLFILLNMSRFQKELEDTNDQLAASEEKIRGQYELLSDNEKKLKESEEKYRHVVTWGNDGILIVQDGLLKFLNPKAAQLCGGNMEDFLGTPFLDTIHPDERSIMKDRIHRRVHGEKVETVYETVLRSRTGENVDVELNAGIIMVDGKPTNLIFLRDTRERKRAQKALTEAKKKLTLLNTIAFNNIRSDTFTLSGYHALMEERYAKSRDADINPLFEKAKAILRKISDSLAFAQAYQDLGASPARWQNVRHVFLLAYSHMNTLAMQHEVRFEDLEIYADSHLELVFEILAGNVFRHAKTATKITISHEENPDGSVTIFFADNGVGIPEDRKAALFQPGYEGKKPGKLFLARAVLEITDMTLNETGTPGSGARFGIRVPKGAFRFTKNGNK